MYRLRRSYVVLIRRDRDDLKLRIEVPVITGPGIAVAFVLPLWVCTPVRAVPVAPVGLYLIIENSLALGYVPFIAALGVLLAAVRAAFGSWWIAVPAGVAPVGALVVIVRVGSARVDVSGALGSGWEDRIPAERRTRMIPPLVDRPATSYGPPGSAAVLRAQDPGRRPPARRRA